MSCIVPQSNSCISFDSYIKPQLALASEKRNVSCISFDSYIKPQLFVTPESSDYSCISFDSYIKPKLSIKADKFISVVYLLIPTSNHNKKDVVNGDM